jgi:serpin B
MLYSLTNRGDKMYAEIYGEDYHDPLRIANAVFVDDGLTLKREFTQAFADCYLGSAMTVDFSAPEAVAAVNQWASDHTEGLIEEIIQSFSPDTAAAIANAIYFSDRWGWEFSPEQTEEDAFYAPEGESTAHYMLREGETLDYYEDERVQAMPLAFTTNGGMLIILPKDGDAKGLLASMDGAYFKRIMSGTLERPGLLKLPRFSINGDVIDLKDALKALGVNLFDSAAAPLTGGLIEEAFPMWVSAAVQKAVIDLDEKGTTAAAVTVIMMEAGAAMPEEKDPLEPFEMICDKPFAFVLYGRTFDGGSQVLFTGVVNEP